MTLNSKNLKPITKSDKLLKSFLDMPLIDREPRNSEVVSVTHVASQDGLREFDYDSGTYVDKSSKGVPTLATKE